MIQKSIKKNIQIFFLSVITIFNFLFLSNNQVQAAQLPISGASAGDAVITNTNGTVVTGQLLNKYTYYNVNYKWSLPANTVVSDGDTVTFTLPKDVEVRVANTEFNVTDEHGHVIGTFEISKNSSTGTLTFNDYFKKNNIKNIHGILEIKVNGTQENKPSTWILNKSGWLDSQNTPNWTVVFNPGSQNLTNVQLIDTLQSNQTFNVNSIQLWYGHVINNQFIAEKKISDPIVQGLVQLSNNNTVMTTKFNKLDKAIQLVYQTNANTATGQFSLTNGVVANCNAGSTTMTATIEVGGKAIAEGTKNSSNSSKASTSSSIVSANSSKASTSSNIVSANSSKASTSSNIVSANSSKASTSSSIVSANSSKASTSSSIVSANSSKASTSSSIVSANSSKASTSSNIVSANSSKAFTSSKYHRPCQPDYSKSPENKIHFGYIGVDIWGTTISSEYPYNSIHFGYVNTDIWGVISNFGTCDNLIHFGYIGINIWNLYKV